MSINKPDGLQSSISRRDIIKRGALGLGSIFGVSKIIKSCDKKEGTGQVDEAGLPSLERYPVLPQGDVELDLTQLIDADHRNLGKDATVFINVMGEPSGYDKHKMNPPKNLERMWQKKINKAGVRSSNQQESYDEYIKPYVTGEKPRHKLTIQEYVETADKCVKLVRDNINFGHGGLSKNQVNLLKSFLHELDGKGLISYGITELCENSGSFGVEQFDIILQNMGIEYLDFIPAMHDDYLSIGPYQFTSLALKEKGNERSGASAFNKYLPENLQIPGSVIKLHRTDHHIAAILFALSNLVVASRGVSGVKINELAHKMQDKMIDIVGYVACAHHNPKHAKRSFVDRAKKNFKGEYDDCVVSRTITGYASKTKKNYRALQKI